MAFKHLKQTKQNEEDLVQRFSIFSTILMDFNTSLTESNAQ